MPNPFAALFGGAPAPAAPTVNAPDQQQAQPPQPDNQQQQQQQQAPEQVDPFAQYQDIWNVQEAQAVLSPDQIVQFQPEQLKQAVAKMNFAGGMNPQQVQAALGGDQQAFMGVINSVAQNVMMQAMSSMATVMNGALGKSHELLMSNLPNEMRKYQTTDTLRSSHPIFTNPGVAPMANALAAQLAKANPGKSAAEISKLTVDYFTNIGKATGGEQTPPQNQQANQGFGNDAGTVNWGNWINQ